MITLQDLQTPQEPSRNSSEFQERTQESAFDAQQVQDLARVDMDFLAGLALPTIYEYAFPPVFLAVWNWLLSFANTERTFPRLVLGLPRGFAKTTVIKLFILFLILFTKRRFIMIVCANEGLAKNIIADVCDMLQEPNILKVFGDYRLGLEIDTQVLKKFGFRGRNVILAGLGINGSPRGLNIKHERPDVMLFDDIQTKEDAESEVVSTGIETSMYSTFMKAKSPRGCIYLFLANMYPTKYSLLRKLKKDPTWVKFIAGGILADGTSLWEALHPIKQLLEEYESDAASGHPEIFHSEVMNDENANINTAIDLTKVPDYPFEEGEQVAGTFIIIDPSNDKHNSDKVAIGGFQVINGTPVLRKCLEERLSPGDTIRKAITMAIELNCALIVIESNAYQYSLLYWSKMIANQLGMTEMAFEPIYSGGLSKNSRILTMFKQLLKGETYIHPEVKALVHSQIQQFNPLRTDNTDNVLDLLTYAPRVLSEMGDRIPYMLPGDMYGVNTADAGVMSIEDNSSF